MEVTQLPRTREPQIKLSLVYCIRVIELLLARWDKLYMLVDFSSGGSDRGRQFYLRVNLAFLLDETLSPFSVNHVFLCLHP